MDRIPCRVSQDLSRYHAEQDRLELEAPEFDALNDDDVIAAAGKTLAPAIQAILQTEFFGLEKYSIEDIRKMHRDLYEAMKTAYEESL